jgi:hypothetical protein
MYSHAHGFIEILLGLNGRANGQINRHADPSGTLTGKGVSLLIKLTLSNRKMSLRTGPEEGLHHEHQPKVESSWIRCGRT